MKTDKPNEKLKYIFTIYPVLKTLHHKLYWIARTLDCLNGKLVIRRGKMYSIYLWKRSLKEIKFHIQFNDNRGCLKFLVKTLRLVLSQPF